MKSFEEQEMESAEELNDAVSELHKFPSSSYAEDY